MLRQKLILSQINYARFDLQTGDSTPYSASLLLLLPLSFLLSPVFKGVPRHSEASSSAKPLSYMKKTSGTSWIPRSRDQPPRLDSQDSNLHHSLTGSHQVPLTPTYTSPRRAPELPPLHLQKPHSSFNKGLQSVFNRRPTFSRAPSVHSHNSGFSVPSQTSSDPPSVHPYAIMAPAPLPVVSSHDATEDEDECPVCLEPLSFSFRLPGEKPHIVPECGHALHEVSYTSHSLHICVNDTHMP